MRTGGKITFCYVEAQISFPACEGTFILWFKTLFPGSCSSKFYSFYLLFEFEQLEQLQELRDSRHRRVFETYRKEGLSDRRQMG